MSWQDVGILVVLVAIAAVLIAIGVWLLHWLYRRSSKETSFVRTGFGGQKVVMNGGAFVLPIIHEITPVNMSTLRIEVRRGRDSAIITHDRMRVDVVAEFHVAVKATTESIAAAAQTLGQRTMDPNALRELIEGKFVDVLRSVAAEMTMEELHEKRGLYVRKVRETVADDLLKNGLELETVSLTNLDQTNMDFFNPSNAFDAEGLTRLTDQIEKRKKIRNDIEQDTMIQIRNKNLETEKMGLEIDRESEYARLEQEREVEARRAAQRAELARERASGERAAEQAQLVARQEVEQTRIATERAVDEERIRRERDVQALEIDRRRSIALSEQQANEEVERTRITSQRAVDEERIQRELAIEQLEIERRQKIELAEQARAIAVANQSKLQSHAQAEADAEREHAIVAEERIFTAREREIAERRKTVELITATLEAERAGVGVRLGAATEKIAAEDRAGALRILADGEADAERVRVAVARMRHEMEADGLQLRNEAENTLSPESRQLTMRLRLLEKIEGIIRESVRPMERIEGIKILQVDGLWGQAPAGHGGAAGDGDGRANMAENIVNSALRYRAQAPLIDSLLREIGVDGGKIGSGAAGMVDAAPPSGLATSK
jgi:uncharacterized membrane protein YqiK